MSLLLAADACLNWSLPPLTEQQVCPPMQYWLNHLPDRAVFKHSLHINCISKSATLCNYTLLPSFLCMCTCEEKWHHKGSHSSSVSSSNCLVRLQTWKKVMGWCSTLWKICCFVQKSWKSMQIWTSLSEEEKRNILAVWWLSDLVLSWCSLAPLGVFIMKTLKD